MRKTRVILFCNKHTIHAYTRIHSGLRLFRARGRFLFSYQRNHAPLKVIIRGVMKLNKNKHTAHLKINWKIFALRINWDHRNDARTDLIFAHFSLNLHVLFRVFFVFRPPTQNEFFSTRATPKTRLLGRGIPAIITAARNARETSIKKPRKMRGWGRGRKEQERNLNKKYAKHKNHYAG